MHAKRIQSNPSWRGEHARRDTVFVVTGKGESMLGLMIARVLLFFSFVFHDVTHECALVHWYRCSSDRPDDSMGLWMVRPDLRHQRTLEVVHVDSIARGCHLIPNYGTRPLPEDFSYQYALTSFPSYYVNSFVDNRVHQFLSFFPDEEE